MNKLLLLFLAATLMLGSCARPMNRHREPDERRSKRDSRPPYDQRDQPGPDRDRRPNQY